MPGPVAWKLRNSTISLAHPVVMGILNVTPDSFSDGGQHGSVDAAVTAGLQMVADGALIVDVGGESTRPGARPIDAAEEMARVVPIVERLADAGVVVSVDTSKPQVADAAIDAGAEIINDVTGFESSTMRRICATTGVGIVIMHMQGTPQTMQQNPRYADVVTEVRDYLVTGADTAQRDGIGRASIAIDPGIGFGKTFDHNIALMQGLESFVDTGFPVLLGTSRKGFLGEILDLVRGTTTPEERDAATAATVALAVSAGVSLLRVHNVPLAVDVAHTAKAMVPMDDGKETNRT